MYHMSYEADSTCNHSCDTEGQCQLQNCKMGLHSDVMFITSVAIICNACNEQLYLAPKSTCSHWASVVSMTYNHACWKLYTVNAQTRTHLLSHSPARYALRTSTPRRLAASCAQPIRWEQPTRCLLADLSLLCTALIWSRHFNRAECWYKGNADCSTATVSTP